MERGRDCERERDPTIFARDEILQAVSRLTNDGIWIRDFRNDKTHYNDRFWEIFGYESSFSAIKDPCSFVVHKDDRKMIAELEQAALLENKSFSATVRYIHRRGYPLWCHIKCSPIGPRSTVDSPVAFGSKMPSLSKKLASGNKTPVPASTRHLSLHYQPEQVTRVSMYQSTNTSPIDVIESPALLHLDSSEPARQVHMVIGMVTDLRYLNKNAEIMQMANARSNEIVDMKTNFMSRVSHELRTPLNAIHGVVQLLGLELKDQQLEYLRMLKQSIHEIITSIDKISEISRVGEMIEMDIQQINLVDLIRSTLASLMSKIDEYRSPIEIYLITTIRENIKTADPANIQAATIRSDVNKTKKVLYEIIDNAIKYGKSKPIEITIDMQSLQRSVKIIVADQGQGFEVKFKNRLFQPFQKLDETNVGLGSGLGLTLARYYIRVLKGDVFCDSSGLDLGATFTVVLPRDGFVGRSEKPHLSHKLVQAFDILIVDDIEENLTSIKEFVLKISPLSMITTASSGLEALGKFMTKNPPYEIVMMDVHLSDVSGLQIIDQMKRISPITNFVAFTADHNIDTVSNIKYMLLKPFTIDELHHVFEKLKKPKRQPISPKHTRRSSSVPRCTKNLRQLLYSSHLKDLVK